VVAWFLQFSQSFVFSQTTFSSPWCRGRSLSIASSLTALHYRSQRRGQGQCSGELDGGRQQRVADHRGVHCRVREDVPRLQCQARCVVRRQKCEPRGGHGHQEILGQARCRGKEVVDPRCQGRRQLNRPRVARWLVSVSHLLPWFAIDNVSSSLHAQLS
jgi:hypothetical protein